VLVVSLRLNYLFGASLGQSPEKAQVFGLVSIVADCWKAAGTIFIYSLARSRRWPPAAAASAVWVVCFLYAVSSALGISVQDRAALTGGRETVPAYAGSLAVNLSGPLKDVDGKRLMISRSL
jgi:hypothetical protein